MSKPTRVGAKHRMPRVVTSPIQDALIQAMVRKLAADAEEVGLVLDWKTMEIGRVSEGDHTTLVVELDATEAA